MEPAEATTISWPPGPFCLLLGLWDEGRTVRNKRGLQALQPGPVRSPEPESGLFSPPLGVLFLLFSLELLNQEEDGALGGLSSGCVVRG